MIHNSLDFNPDNFTRPKVLIVDDEPLNIQIIHAALHEDADMFMANSGEQALAMVEEVMPDLILLDVVMPDMDGYATLERLKVNNRTAGIPVIFITANNKEADEVRGLEVGAMDFIHKPINPTILKARVQTQLSIKRYVDTIRMFALVDGLTGVANRRRFDEDLVKIWKHAVRYEQSLSIVLFDIDHFKKYNDFYGHQKGDDCLVAVAGAAQKAMRRPADILARYGGEEFACILPDTGMEGATIVSTAVLEQVRMLAIPHEGVNGDAIVSVSIGAATVLVPKDKNPTDLIKSADDLLYQAKREGRNTIRSGEF
ncbi:diguanylate cyclase domain-containing protein [Rhodospirillum sp. A1_3_36]|uniref:diguanylate cyclase domain-containing protein n=1 Tax=Rhodospirillum sp. A1_3_36 TaxID=3391666 RepID=UPI0039A6E6E8